MPLDSCWYRGIKIGLAKKSYSRMFLNDGSSLSGSYRVNDISLNWKARRRSKRQSWEILTGFLSPKVLTNIKLKGDCYLEENHTMRVRRVRPRSYIQGLHTNLYLSIHPDIRPFGLWADLQFRKWRAS